MQASAMNTEENKPHLTAMIVGSYVRHHTVGANQLSELITTVHHALDKIGPPVQPEETRTPAVSVRGSVRHDFVVCMDCGFKAVTLRRHLRIQHGLSPVEYLQRWGLKRDHPLTAPAYSQRRSAMAKEAGLGRKAATETLAQAPIPIAAEPETQPTPKRKPTIRRATKAVGVASEAAAAPTPATKRKPRSRAGVASQP
jgi:predicted transcriptional regulator